MQPIDRSIQLSIDRSVDRPIALPTDRFVRLNRVHFLGDGRGEKRKPKSKNRVAGGTQVQGAEGAPEEGVGDVSDDKVIAQKPEYQRLDNDYNVYS